LLVLEVLQEEHVVLELEGNQDVQSTANTPREGNLAKAVDINTVRFKHNQYIN
jgi:hypothetical protein